jgi:hypothetical protein
MGGALPPPPNKAKVKKHRLFSDDIKVTQIDCGLFHWNTKKYTTILGIRRYSF